MNLASRTMPEGENTPQSPPLTPEEIAEYFPQFEILEYLGRGGMGIVYKARQKVLDRIVAIKVLAGERRDDPQFKARFSSEAKILAKLSHPNIVTIHDFGENNGMFYLVMEYVDGVNLRDVLHDGRMEPDQALAIVPPICEALQYAHDLGIVHRDIKPENILMDQAGRVKIADFGIATLVGVAAESSGTPPYMAPEQETADGTVDHRADIYALGVVFYEMLTGESPERDPSQPSQHVEIDVRLDEIVLRALKKEPEQRYQTAGEFRTMVETMVSERRTPTVAPKSRVDRRATTFGAVLGGVCGMMAVLYTGIMPPLTPLWQKVVMSLVICSVVTVVFILGSWLGAKNLRGRRASSSREMDAAEGDGLKDPPAVTAGPASLDEPQPSTTTKMPAYWRLQGVDRRSKRTIFGLPLWHVATGVDPSTGRHRTARGIIAIGDRAQGVVALGGVAMGVFAFGGASIGLVSWGGLAVGLFAVGGCGVALIAAFAGMAIAPVALGGMAVGWYTFGGQGFGVHVASAITQDPEGLRFFDRWAIPLIIRMSIVNVLLVPVFLLFSVGLPYWFKRNELAKRDTNTIKHVSPAKALMLATIILGMVVAAGISMFQFVPEMNNQNTTSITKSKSAENTPEQVAREFMDAMREKETTRASALLTKELQQGHVMVHLPHFATWFASFYSSAPERLTEFKQWLRDGEYAAVRLAAPSDEEKRTLCLVLQQTSDGWRIAGIDDMPRDGNLAHMLAGHRNSLEGKTNSRISAKIVVEEAALHFLVAVREKDEKTLRALCIDRVKGWADALVGHFSMELRERFKQSTGKEFTLYPGKSLVDGDLAVVQCVAAADLQPKLKNNTLVLYFCRTETGWKVWTLQGGPVSKSLDKHLEQARKWAAKWKTTPDTKGSDKTQTTPEQVARSFMNALRRRNSEQAAKLIDRPIARRELDNLGLLMNQLYGADPKRLTSFTEWFHEKPYAVAALSAPPGKPDKKLVLILKRIGKTWKVTGGPFPSNSDTSLVDHLRRVIKDRERGVDQTKALRVRTLSTMREYAVALATCLADTTALPPDLQTLVDKKYLRELTLIKNHKTGKMEPPLYHGDPDLRMEGLDVTKYVLLASPSPDKNGKRVVGFLDSSVKMIDEADYQQLLKAQQKPLMERTVDSFLKSCATGGVDTGKKMFKAREMTKFIEEYGSGEKAHRDHHDKLPPVMRFAIAKSTGEPSPEFVAYLRSISEAGDSKHKAQALLLLRVFGITPRNEND